MKEKANYFNKKKNNNNKIDHFLAFRRKAKMNILFCRLGVGVNRVTGNRVGAVDKATSVDKAPSDAMH